MRYFLFVLIVILPFLMRGQLHCTLKDRELCEDYLSQLSQLQPDSFSTAELAVLTGEKMLGIPYAGKTLEVSTESEPLVVNLQGLDCTTFLENTVVMARLTKTDSLNFEAFQRELAFIRYRNGKQDGYPSRLHYLSEWLIDNEKKGILTNITQDLGGVPINKTINFMSTHRGSYAQMAIDENFEAVQNLEDSLNQHEICYIPKNQIHRIESQIQHGDIIAFSTGIKGLDVVHVGMAYRKNGRVHLLHASTTTNQVSISARPLAEYTTGIKSQNGIMVARLN